MQLTKTKDHLAVILSNHKCSRTLHNKSTGQERIFRHKEHSTLLRQDKLSGAADGLGQSGHADQLPAAVAGSIN